MAKVEVRFVGEAPRPADAHRVVASVIALLEESPDQSLVVSSIRLANMCGLSWGGNHGTAEALRRLTGVRA